jgi:hypothetical protein
MQQVEIGWADAVITRRQSRPQNQATDFSQRGMREEDIIVTCKEMDG